MDIKMLLSYSFENWLGRMLTSFLGLWGVVEIVEWIGWKPLEQSALSVKAYVFISAGLIIWFIITLVLHTKTSIVSKPLPTTMIETLKTLALNKQYESVIRYRDGFSRAMFVEGKPSERLRLGEIIEDSALKTGNKEIQAAALIDDIGWTLVTMKEFDKAENNILHGQKIALEIDDPYWTSKSYRHLAGLYFEKKNYKKATEHLDSARKFAQRIPAEIRKQEMIAGIEYGAALTALKLNNNEEALSHLEISEQLRKKVGDQSRIVKMYALKGKIAEAINDIQYAHDCFRQGLEKATMVGRTDEIILNHLGLARVYDAKNDPQKAAEHRDHADQLRKNTPVPFES